MNEKILSDRIVSIEKLQYKTDQLAHSLAILGLIVNVLYFITLYKNNDNFYYSWKMGMSVLYNLIFMLMVFLFAEEVKHYHRNYAVCLLIIGVLQFVRIFVYPKEALTLDGLSSNSYTLISTYLMISGLLLIISGICSFIKSTILIKFIKTKKISS